MLTIVTTSADDENESLTITKTYQLDEDSKIFGALLESTDASGIITKYMYDTNNGRLLATLTGSYGIAYTYDTWGRMIKATPATVSGNSYSSINNAENVAYSYDDKGNLSSISTDTTTYTLTYDEFGNTTEIEAGDNTLATYEYNDYNGKLCKIVYGNGLIVEYIYNSLELLEKICYTYSNGTTETITEYTYTRDGNLHSVKDFKSSSTTVYEYDSIGRVSGSYKYSEFEDSNAETTLSEGFIYDGSNGRLSSSNHRWVYLSGSIRYNVEHQYDYVYNQDGTLCQSNVSINGDSSSVTNMLVNYEYDYLKRPDKITYISGDYIIRSEEFGYITQGTTNGALTGMIESYTSSVASNTTTYVYSYDSRGNITKIVVGDKEIRYTYDDLGQLTREENELLNQSFAYTYDDAGNIKSKKVCNLTTGAVARNNDYYYSSSAWGDRLTAFGGTGQITYDAIGNPLTYNNGITYHFTWEGRNLTRVYTSGYATHFTYNSDGIRTARYSDNGSRTEFILNGSQILAEVSEDSVIAYIYDANGSPIGMQHRLTTYAEDVWDIFWFDKNLQGDIVAVYNEYGVKCISYAYDAWGNSRVTTHDETGTNKYAIKNSFRYRGYYYDRTISMYYLNSRYYDPITCRFINADSYASTGQGLIGHNMFAYCGNNPVMRVDPTGEAWYNDLYDWINTIVGLQNPMSKITLIGAIVVAMIQGNWSGLAHDINSGALDPFNDDEKIALESQVVGFYKGETVIRHSIPNTSSAQILGTIFLNNSEGYNPDGIDTLNHEWGHGVQERLLGTGAYLLFVGVPSAYYCYNGGYLSAPYPLDEKMYYSKIWERTADCFGGVNRNNYFDFWYKDNFIFWQ